MTGVPRGRGVALAADDPAESRRFPSVLERYKSVIGTGTAITGGVAFILALGALGVLDLAFMVHRWDTLWIPAFVSVSLTTAAFLVGFGAAMPLGLIRAYAPNRLRAKRGAASETLSFARARELHGRRKAVRIVAARKIRVALLAPAYGLASGYVEGFRGTPFLIQLNLVFFFVISATPRLPRNFPIDIFWVAAFLALTLNTIGYQAEVLRAGFQSVGQGQIEAAKAIGMKGSQIFRRVTLAQALRLVVLPLTNEVISLLKASSIVSIIAVHELTFQGGQLAVNEGHPIEAFVMISAMYILVIVPLGRLVAYLEEHRRIPGLGTPAGLPTRVWGRRRPPASAEATPSTNHPMNSRGSSMPR